MSAQSPVDPESPLAKAWDSYQQTEGFANSKHWALKIIPMRQAWREDDKRYDYDLMPFDQRERHVMGSLWAAFMAGYLAAKEPQP